MSAFQDPAARPSAAFVTRSADHRSYILLAQIIPVCAALFLLEADWRTLTFEWISRLLLLHFIWSLWSWRKLAGSLLSPYPLFLSSATLFNAGLGLIEALHLNREPILEEFPPDIRTRSLILVFAALSALHLGALIALPPRTDSFQRQPESSPISDRALRLVGWGLLAISFVPLVIQLKDAVSIALSAGYMALYQQELAPVGLGSAIQIATDLAVPGTFFLIVGSKKRNFERRAALVALLSYCGTLLFLGARGGSMMPLVALAWLWDRTIARLPRTLLIGGTVILLVGVFPLVRSTRELSAAERKTVSVGETYSELREHPAVDAVTEMGGSIVAVAHTLELVPRYRPYTMGTGYIYAVLTIMPSLFWDRHPTASRGSASAWLIEMVDPDAAKLGTGLGFTFVAEAFMNFGTLGVPLVSLLLGYGVVWFWLWAERGRNLGRFAAVAILLPYLLFLARGESAILPRSLLWYSLVPYGAYLYLRRVLQAPHETP